MTGVGSILGVAPAPIAADVGIVAALGVEVGFLTDRLAKVRKYAGPSHRVIEGEAAGKLVALIVGGAGRDAAQRATERLNEGHRPRWVISAGFAGALDPSFRLHDIVLPTEVVEPDGAVFPTALGPGHGIKDARHGRLLTVDAIVRTAAEKSALRDRYKTDLVDMESSAVASVCAARGTRFVSVRVVSDEAAVDLPKEVVAMMTRSGSYLVGSALRAIWNRPSALKDFWHLYENAQESAERLADATLAVIGRLSGV
jgi:adenosylhomocysteine nucleosidase